MLLRILIALITSLWLISAISLASFAHAGNWLNNTSYLSALEAIQQHNYGQAKEQLLTLAKIHPKQPRIYLDLALLAQKLRQPNELAHWQQVLEKNFLNSPETAWAKALSIPENTIPYTAVPLFSSNSESLPVMPAIETSSAGRVSPQQPGKYLYPWEMAPSQPQGVQSGVPQPPQASAAPQAPPAILTPSINTPQTTANQTQIDPALMQQLMILQMLGNTGNSNQQQQQGFNPAALMTVPMMNSLPGANSGYGAGYGGAIEPEVMSQMMMNQMMGGMDFGFSNGDNDR